MPQQYSQQNGSTVAELPSLEQSLVARTGMMARASMCRTASAGFAGTPLVVSLSDLNKNREWTRPQFIFSAAGAKGATGTRSLTRRRRNAQCWAVVLCRHGCTLGLAMVTWSVCRLVPHLVQRNLRSLRGASPRPLSMICCSGRSGDRRFVTACCGSQRGWAFRSSCFTLPCAST